jgi:hypothetical protein
MAQDLLDRFRALTRPHDGIEVKGKKTAYTAVNGNMFAFLSPEGELCLRFDEATRAEIAARYATGPVVQYGAVMRGYVAVPVVDLAGDDTLDDLFSRSLAHARSLPAKPTKRVR